MRQNTRKLTQKPTELPKLKFARRDAVQTYKKSVMIRSGDEQEKSNVYVRLDKLQNSKTVKKVVDSLIYRKD